MANGSIQLVKQVAVAPALSTLPFPIAGTLAVIQRVHIAWAGKRYFDVYSKPENWGSVTVGGIADGMINNSVVGAPLKASLYLVLLIEKTLQCQKQAEKIVAAWRELCAVAKGQHPVARSYEWIHETHSLFSPSTRLWFATSKDAVVDRITQILCGISGLLWEIGQLTMRIMDVVSLRDNTSRREFYVSALLRDGLTNEQFLIAETAETQLKSIEKLLDDDMKKMPSFKISQYIKPAVKGMKTLHRTLGSKDFTNGVFSIIGQTQLISRQETIASERPGYGVVHVGYAYSANRK
ncbi:MAG: hypothetical protein H0X51_02240 [Parachlamydiaceae bacterium]|nr:hypothetical protein [Parachlamydiaceae bacterium]